MPWHTDQAYSGKIDVSNFNNPDGFFLKIFIYLTDVGPDDGCMSYVQGSHKIGYAIRKAIYEKKFITSHTGVLKILNKSLLLIKNILTIILKARMF